jgi:hypothetical protein
LSDKVTRGKAKALLVKIKRGSAERPSMPDMSASAPVQSQSSIELTQEQTIALVVNESLDGNNDPLNAIKDKVTRGKAKALLVKIKRGSAERPQRPSPASLDQSSQVPAEIGLSKDQVFAIAVNKGANGDMEAVNAIEDRVTRGKVKALLVKIKRGAAELPPMPDISPSKNAPANEQKAESEDEMITRLVAVGVGGDMEEINALENRVIRGKIKAAIVKEKRKK